MYDKIFIILSWLDKIHNTLSRFADLLYDHFTDIDILMLPIHLLINLQATDVPELRTIYAKNNSITCKHIFASLVRKKYGFCCFFILVWSVIS